MSAVQSDASRAEGEGQDYDYVQLLRQTIYKENVTQMAGSTGGEKYHVENYRNCLGTTNSCVAVYEGGERVIIPNAQGGAPRRLSLPLPRMESD